jgi:hypothetical protein
MGRRTWMIVAASVAAAGVLAVAGDRLAAHAAAGTVADRLACAAGLEHPPSVTLGGFPFLTQAAAGRYSEVDVLARDVRRADVTIDAVRADLHDVSLSAGNRFSAGRVGIDATVGYQALPAEVNGRQLSYQAAGGLLAVSTTTILAGRSVPVTILAELAIAGSRLTITPRQIEVLGVRVPAGPVLSGMGAPDLSRDLPALPAGLRYESLTAGADGVHVRITGDHVTATPPVRSCGGAAR